MFTAHGRASFALLLALGLSVATGCSVDPRTSNQGGGSLLSAGTKLMNHQIGSLTADEWQALKGICGET